MGPGGTYLGTAHFSDDLPGLVEDGQPLGLRRVGTCQTPAQGPKQQVLGGGGSEGVTEGIGGWGRRTGKDDAKPIFEPILKTGPKFG